MASGIVQSDNKNPERVAAGYKATIHNPTVSDEAKSNARSRLNEMGVALNQPASTQQAKQTVDTHDEADYGSVLDDQDETLLNNGRDLQAETRGASKPGQYRKMDSAENDDADFGNIGRSQGFHGDQPGENREMGGYKATLKNPNVSNEAKQTGKGILRNNDQM